LQLDDALRVLDGGLVPEELQGLVLQFLGAYRGFVVDLSLVALLLLDL